MRKFDLEAAKRGEPIQTRGGRPVRFIAHILEAKCAVERVVVLQEGHVKFRHEDGTVMGVGSTIEDIVMAPKKRTVWVNLYPESRAAWCYSTQEEADEQAGLSRINRKAYPVEIEE